jgi:hypothetical protein
MIILIVSVGLIGTPSSAARPIGVSARSRVGNSVHIEILKLKVAWQQGFAGLRKKV